MKKLFSVLLVVFMLGAMMIPATAENDGSITIKNLNADAQYDIYQLLDLESYNTETNAYSYTVNAAWSTFFTTEDALEYVSIEKGYVSWLKGDNEADTIAFSQLALSYAKNNGIQPTATFTNTAKQELYTFNDLSLGYYLVDSNVGILCSLNTTKPHVDIEEKNTVPVIEKQVQEDSDQSWNDDATADIQQVISFKTTIHATDGAEGYVLHDKMSDAFVDFSLTSVTLYVDGVDIATETKALTQGTDYTLYTGDAANQNECEEACTFEIVFTEAFCDSLKDNDDIVVLYQAVLGENATIGSVGNPNKTFLDYGENHTTVDVTATTYTYGWDLVKTDSSDILLDGAEFKIYNALTGGTEVKVVKVDGEENVYRRAEDDEIGETIVVTNGKVHLIGFDNDTYYLEETKAPEGYNKLSSRQEFKIEDADLDATILENQWEDGGVRVINKTGSEMPITGAKGTVIFMVVGGLLVVGSAILLFVKKRMSQIGE